MQIYCYYIVEVPNIIVAICVLQDTTQPITLEQTFQVAGCKEWYYVSQNQAFYDQYIDVDDGDCLGTPNITDIS